MSKRSASMQDNAATAAAASFPLQPSRYSDEARALSIDDPTLLLHYAAMWQLEHAARTLEGYTCSQKDFRSGLVQWLSGRLEGFGAAPAWAGQGKNGLRATLAAVLLPVDVFDDEGCVMFAIDGAAWWARLSKR
jgi:hypothetical protein